jgi:hypothetical protein
MKTITIKIPTSFKEWKNWVQERVKARKRHNQDVLWEFAQAISREAYSNYWKNDISNTMVDTLFSIGGNSKLTHLYFEAKQKLK